MNSFTFSHFFKTGSQPQGSVIWGINGGGISCTFYLICKQGTSNMELTLTFVCYLRLVGRQSRQLRQNYRKLATDLLPGCYWSFVIKVITTSELQELYCYFLSFSFMLPASGWKISHYGGRNYMIIRDESVGEGKWSWKWKDSQVRRNPDLRDGVGEEVGTYARFS